MPSAQCFMCNTTFFNTELVDDGLGYKCSKCKKRQPGMSQSELRNLNNMPQCIGCGVTSNSIQTPICNRCIDYYKSAESTPNALLAIPGVYQLLHSLQPSAEYEDSRSTETHTFSEGGSMSAKAIEILGTSSTFQALASENRLGRPSVGTGGLNRFKSIVAPSARAIRNDRSSKAQETKNKLENGGISIHATLYAIQMGNNSKMTALSNIRAVLTTNPTRQCRDAFGELLAVKVVPLIKTFYAQAKVKQLTWENIMLYAQESGGKAVSLGHFDLTRSVHELFIEEFVAPRLIRETMRKDKKIEVRLVVDESLIYGDEDESNYPNLTSKRKSMGAALLSVRKRAISAAPSRPLSAPATHDYVRKSAFPTRLSGLPWTRKCDMVEISFYRTEVIYDISDGLSVKFHETKHVDSMEIAASHEHLPSGKGQYSGRGFIGVGSCKKAIYGRFEGKEYVVTQPECVLTSPDEVKRTLFAEYALLRMCAAFKEEFDKLESALMIDEELPDFYFNFEGSILGRILPDSDNLDEDSPLPHRYFLATPLLPCGGQFNSPVRKFTGNDEMGDMGLNNDPMTQAVHAFTHFCMEETGHDLVFCDLQGTFDKVGRMCLIDPQAHSAVPIQGCEAVFWNGGQKAVERFRQEHEKDCSKNWICNVLRLRETQIVRPGQSAAPPAKKVAAPPRPAKKKRQQASKKKNQDLDDNYVPSDDDDNQPEVVSEVRSKRQRTGSTISGLLNNDL